MTKSESIHLDKVASLGCIICRRNGLHTPPQIHHIRAGQGMGQRASHYETIPLCYHHHQGEHGIHHMGTRAWEAKHGTERELLREVLELILEGG